jgi:hypothetical protein
MRVMLQRHLWLNNTLYYRDYNAGAEIPDTIMQRDADGNVVESKVELFKRGKDGKQDPDQFQASKELKVITLPPDARLFDKPEPPKQNDLLRNAGQDAQKALSEMSSGNKSLDLRSKASVKPKLEE